MNMGQAVALALHPRLFSLFATARAVPGLVVPGLVGHGLMGLALAAALADQVDWRWVFLALLLVLPVADADLNLTHPADPILTRGWKPTV